jgi:hypothetical protein
MTDHAAVDDLTPPSVETVTGEAPAIDLTPPTEKPKRASRKKSNPTAATEGAPADAEVQKPAKEKSARSNLAKVYPEDATITVLAEKNPKKAGSAAAAIFEFYKSGQTVGDFFAATAGFSFKDKKRPGTYADITYDVGHGYIKVG